MTTEHRTARYSRTEHPAAEYPTTADASGRATPRALGGRGFRRLALIFGAISIIATAVVIGLSNPAAMLEAMGALEARYLALIALAILAEWVTDVFRYYTTALALGVRLDTVLVIRITFANLFFAYLTPGGGFGAPIVTYMLYRRGIDLPRAIAIALIKPLLSMFVLIPGLTLMTAIGGGEFVGAPELQAVIAGTGGVAWTGIMLLLLSSIWPGLMRRVIDAPLRWIARRGFVARRFSRQMESIRGGVHHTIGAFGLYFRGGWVLPLLSFLAAIANIAAICAIGVALLQGFGAQGGQVQLWGLSLLYVAIISIAPTPGGSGIAEATGLGIFDSVFDAAGPVGAFVVLWRLLTCYLPLVIGAVMFARFLSETSLDKVASVVSRGPGEGPAPANDPPQS